ncbi:ribosomal RNA adenine dimethylase [Pseudonocardia sp. N23]|nr:ribosomal RNA adenine dimethylase [Pseudonocardia sp. N23]
MFVGAAARAPQLVGAVVPSGRRLADALTAVVPRTGSPFVAELGPGSGTVSRAVGRRLPGDGRHVAVEIDAAFARHLRRTLPDTEVVHGDAADLRDIVDRPVDVVVSGLPWSLFDEMRQRSILGAVRDVLAGDGAFTTFAYRHAAGLSGARRFRRLLDEHFDEVIDGRTVWRNVPPAGVLLCRRPIRGGAA